MFRDFKDSPREIRRTRSSTLADQAPEFFSVLTQDNFDSQTALCHYERFSFIWLNSYRVTESEKISKAYKSIVESAGKEFAVILKSDGEKISVYLAVRNEYKNELINVVESVLPSVKLDGECSVTDVSPYSSVIVGDFDAGIIDWDVICRSLRKTAGVFCMFCKAVPQETINTQMAAFEKIKADFAEHKKATVTTGSRTIERVNGSVETASNQIEAIYKRLLEKNAVGKMYEVTLTVSASDGRSAERLATTVISSFHTESDETRLYCRPLIARQVNGCAVRNGTVSVPVCCNKKEEFALYKNRLASILSSKELAEIVPIPRDEHPGFYVSKSQRDLDAYNEFDIKPHEGEPGAHIELGTVAETGSPEYIKLSSLMQHGLLTGASGAGKTTSALKIIKSADEAGVRSFIMEPVKGEFQKLPEFGVDAEIFSAGFSARRLEFNPFVPQNLVYIRDHCSGLVEAITSHSDNESPIPEALTMLIMHCYRKHGWKSEDIYFEGDKRSVPTFSEVYDEIVPYFSSVKLYSGEVRTNVYSALTVRLQVIKDFSFLQGDGPLDIKTMLTKNTVIQFDGLSRVSDKCFFGNLILLNLNEYIRNFNYSKSLRNLIVIDEAHNFFERENGGRTSSRSKASENISNAISELRAYGVGFLICDQRPSAVSQAVISNTAVKICHACEYLEDTEELSQSLHLTEYQSGLLHSLKPGEAIVSVRGDRSVVKVKVENPEAIDKHRVGICRFCPKNGRCGIESEDSVIKNIPIDYYLGKFHRSISDHQMTAAVCDELAKESGVRNTEFLCLAGHIIEHFEGVRMREYLNFRINQIINERRM